MRLDERERLVHSLGSNSSLILRNHGLLTLGRTIPEAFLLHWRLNRACEVQLAAQGARLRSPPKEVCEQSLQMGDEFLNDAAPMGELEFKSLTRIIDSEDASYKN
jgi:ribulose-5-phosphate 4-epimerase/fuculose-1-phosphate aldolase